VEWQEAIGVLVEWEGSDVVVVPFLGPGISFRPLRGTLKLEHPRKGVVRLVLPSMSIALPRATFIEADWVAGRDEQGLSVVQGGARVDVFLDGEGD
jgi:hypothetical protein